jgi:hypothetical protein
MAEVKLGVDNLKKVLVAVLHLANKIDSITQDGFQPVSDLVALVPNLVDGVSIIKNGKDALAEFKELDVLEKQEVLDFVKVEFDLADDVLEDVVESALGVIKSVSELVVKIKVALKKV